MIKKILNDILKNGDNKYSSKKVMIFIAFITAIFIILLSFLFNNTFKYPLDILLMLFTMSGFTSVVSTVANGFNKFSDEKKEIENVEK